MNYSWASNEKKLERAILSLKAAGQPETEEAVKALYVKYGGLVLDQTNSEPEETKEVHDAKPKRKRIIKK